MHPTERLVMMVNQIAQAFAHQGESRSAASVADHLRRFWDPRMRAAIRAHAAEGGADLLPTARAAIELLPDPRSNHAAAAAPRSSGL